jgi:BirA family transcriptional regulator, biotin operon repressor / biotin---[acetyl-CoA-carboxylase] ligase
LKLRALPPAALYSCNNMTNFIIRKLQSTASTNADARLAAADGVPDGTVIWALSQTGGKGRHGRVWSSPVGNLYASLIVHPRRAFSPGLYSFAMALAIRGALAEKIDSSLVKLKWPNDVLVDGKKISGILLEAEGRDDGFGWLVIGFGVNVQSHPDETSYPATHLSAHSASAELEPVLQSILAHFQHWRDLLEQEGFAALRESWLQSMAAREQLMNVQLPDRTLNGHFVDLDLDGCLLIKDDNGKVHSISAGDVFFDQGS